MGAYDPCPLSDRVSLPSLQHGEKNKSIELRHLADYTGVPIHCIVLFDDMEFNRKYAENVSRPGAGGEGGGTWKYAERECESPPQRMWIFLPSLRS